MLDVVRHIRSEDFDTVPAPRGEIEEALAGSAVTTPFALSVYFETNRVGLVPFVHESHPTWRRPARIVRFAGAPDGPPLDVSGEHPATSLTAALVHLAAHRDEWDVLMLDVRERPVRTRTSLRLAKLSFAMHVFPGELGDDPTTRFVSWSQPAWKSWPLRLDRGLSQRLRTPPRGPRAAGRICPPRPPCVSLPSPADGRRSRGPRPLREGRVTGGLTPAARLGSADRRRPREAIRREGGSHSIS